MKIRFNKFEKVAGLFVGLAALTCVVGLVALAAKNGWFARKVQYAVELESADGVHPGTIVQIAGLRVGSVTEVNLKSNDRVLVEFEVLEKFKNKVRKDSHVQMFRPFILADKVLEVSVGSEGEPELPIGETLPAEASFDVMDMLSGKKMSSVARSFEKLTASLKIIGEAFSDPERSHAMVEMFDRLNPLVRNLNTMSEQVVKLASTANKQKRMEDIVSNLALISRELGKAVPAFSKEVPNVGTQLGQIVANLDVLTTEFKKLTPAISAVAPELPRTSRRAVEALDETVVLLKAMQRSFLLRGSVEEVRKEESRRPANTSEP